MAAVGINPLAQQAIQIFSDAHTSPETLAHYAYVLADMSKKEDYLREMNTAPMTEALILRLTNFQGENTEVINHAFVILENLARTYPERKAQIKAGFASLANLPLLACHVRTMEKTFSFLHLLIQDDNDFRHSIGLKVTPLALELIPATIPATTMTKVVAILQEFGKEARLIDGITRGVSAIITLLRSSQGSLQISLAELINSLSLHQAYVTRIGTPDNIKQLFISMKSPQAPEFFVLILDALMNLSKNSELGKEFGRPEYIDFLVNTIARIDNSEALTFISKALGVLYYLSDNPDCLAIMSLNKAMMIPALLGVLAQERLSEHVVSFASLPLQKLLTKDDVVAISKDYAMNIVLKWGLPEAPSLLYLITHLIWHEKNNAQVLINHQKYTQKLLSSWNPSNSTLTFLLSHLAVNHSARPMLLAKGDDLIRSMLVILKGNPSLQDRIMQNILFLFRTDASDLHNTPDCILQAKQILLALDTVTIDTVRAALLPFENQLAPGHNHDPVVVESTSVMTAPQITYEELEFTGHILGNGGTSIIRTAQWRGTPVAVKDVRVHPLNPKEVQAFQEEAERYHALRHPNIILLHGAMMARYAYLIVLELMPKASLYSLLRNSGETLPWSIRLSMIKEVIAGLHHIHEHGLIHADIKSENVLVDDRLHVKISDFGSCKPEFSPTTEAGTITFMAPELFFASGRGGQYTRRSDIFALAVLMWELASRQIPFDGFRIKELPTRVIAGERNPISADTPAKIAAVIQKCWSQKPEDRPASAIDILPELPVEAELG